MGGLQLPITQVIPDTKKNKKKQTTVVMTDMGIVKISKKGITSWVTEEKTCKGDSSSQQITSRPTQKPSA